MSTLTPTLTLTGTAADFGAKLALSVTDSLALANTSIVHNSQEVMSSTAHTTIAALGDYTKSYVFLKNLSSTANQIITITGRSFSSATVDYNNDPTTTMDAADMLNKLVVGMSIHGTDIPAETTVASITNTTTFEASATIGASGAQSNVTCVFGEQMMTLGAGEFAFFPWTSTYDLGAFCATGTPTLEVRIFQA